MRGRLRKLLAALLCLGLLTSSAGALTVEQARKLLQTYYIDEIPRQVLDQPTVEDMLRALGDPYTVYYTPQEYREFMDSMEDTELVGIGIRAYYLQEGILLTQVAPGSPAQAGGLAAGDTIITVDGHDTRGADTADIESWIRGERGTQVALTVQRGEETFRVELKRQDVVFPTVTLEKIDNGLGWISCSAFGSTTFQGFYQIVTAYDDQVDEWIVDLRDNGGGDVSAAVFSAGCFGGWGTGAYLRDRSGDYANYRSSLRLLQAQRYEGVDLSAFDEQGRLTEKPVHVLVDEYTASAAELFAAALRDAGTGLIIGARTYGKGVAQTLLHSAAYFPDGDALKVTTQRTYSVAGATFDKVGVLPHLLVDADWADEVAALLAAPLGAEEQALFLCGLCGPGRRSDVAGIPLSVLQDPANAQAAAQLLSALPAAASCRLGPGSAGSYEQLEQISVEQAAALCGVAPADRTFSDTAGSLYAGEIDTLGVYGILSGGSEESRQFGPDGALDRASLCALLGKAMRWPVSQAAPSYDDVPADSWYAPYVAALSGMGIVAGGDDGLFHPEDPVTHEQFALILGRTARWLDMDCYEYTRPDGTYGALLPGEEELEQRYGAFAPWAREMVWLCDGCQLWADGLSQADPAAATTRGEAAASVYRLLYQSGVLP